jgi:small subunit ribosomal protein S11
VPAASSTGAKFDTGRIYIHATYNNTLITLTDEQGNTVAQSSAGKLGFNGPKKATPYAAAKVVEALGDVFKKTKLKRVMVFVNGIGSGRESALRALPGQGLELISIRDITPIPHNGVRARKPRRV